MSSATKAMSLIILAVGMIAPCALFEAYIVFRYGYAEPYSYMFSIPLGVVSFFLMQFAVGYAVVKGWENCKMSRAYPFIAIWLVSVFMLWAFPCFFPAENIL